MIKNESVDMLEAGSSSLKFWNNKIDGDKVWNDA